MVSPCSMNLEEFRVSISNGFLPDELPLQSLPSLYYSRWEEIMKDLPSLLQGHLLRQSIDVLPILSTSNLKSEPEWRRAYVILCFLTHSYIWGGELPSQRLPAAIAVPLSEVADHFGLPCTATYAALNLWNYAPISPDASLSQPEKLTSLNTFTGTQDEEWFYLISVAMEARGGSVIADMMRALDAIDRDESGVISESLFALAKCFQELGVLLGRMYERCDPNVFYYKIRPYLAGSRSMTVAGLPRGVYYEDGKGGGEWRQYSGGSNAQSSLIQFFDAVLGIEHHSTGEMGLGKKTKEHSFIKNVDKKNKLMKENKEMRRYMPAPHARFLEGIPSTKLRDYVLTQAAEHDGRLAAAYDAAIASLAAFRDTHILIVTRYVVLPSQALRPDTHALAPEPTTVTTTKQQEQTLNLATASLRVPAAASEKDNVALQGTGGTSLLPFLKQTRDETRLSARVV
ncbi:MAG: hypothetical protein M1818_005803 [Claussenomyces sp. TS43310]|nr:MAG: hypothetical protein M1818_005803 [Claussenomyces sp. TS43310]